MELGIAGRKALVVGASKGIGRAIAVAFAGEGAEVTDVARSDELLGALVAEMGGGSAGHDLFATDLMADGAPHTTAERLLQQRGPFDIVVHSVGGPLDVRDPLSPVELWRRVWQFNVGIAIEMNELLIPPMIERNWGRVIHISSISAVMLRGAPPYACSKAYLNAYTKTIGRALADRGVVVSAVLPGAVAFEGSYWDKFVKEGHPRVEDFLRHHQAVGRMGTPEEIACFALLLGSELAGFAQAAVVPVDGGNM
jgi:3-oxoacyl-[acyl-carrier protein] reductase